MGIFVFLYLYKRIAKERKGQIAPLMIMLIATTLVCMMVVFNLGKVALTQVNTQNAADAGALAASSFLASGSNIVADIGQMMNDASWSFIAVMYKTVWPSPGAAYAAVAAFIADQIIAENQANEIDELVQDRAEELGLLYSFINAGVDEQKRIPEPTDDYVSWRKEDTPFSEFLEDGDYTSGEYNWNRWTRFQRSDGESKNVYRKYRPVSVEVDVGSIPSIDYSIGVLPGLTWAVISCGPKCIAIIPIPYVVVPAYLTVNGNRSVDVEVTHTEEGADWGYWAMEIPTISSSATASTTGSSSVFTGGDYDSNLTSVD